MKKVKLLALLPLLLLSSCGEEKRTPLGWCLWEIQKHDGYENPDFMSYEKGIEKGTFLITTITHNETLETKWACCIDYKISLLEYNTKVENEPFLKAEDVISIDCDILEERTL